MSRPNPPLHRPGRRPARAAPAYHHGDLPRALLDAAESMLAETGVDGFTLRECARRAGVSHGAPAHHFGDVRGLLTEFTAESFEQLAASMQRQRHAAPADAFSQLVAVGLAYVDYALAHRARFQLMFRSDRLAQGTPRLRAASAASYGHLLETMRLVAESAGAPGALLQEKVALAWSIVHGFATLMLDNALFAAPTQGRPKQTLALVRRLLEMSRDAFELRALPAAAGS